MKHHGVLYYLIADAIADLRAWAITKRDSVITKIDTLRAFLWSLYADGGQSIAIIEADARAALRRAKL